MMVNKPKIVVVGAYGYTGNLVAQELERLNIPFTAVGRNEEKLEALKNRNSSCEKVKVADIQHQDQFSEWLEAAQLVINCAGPFNYYASPLIDACAALGLVYFDITGEQQVVLESYSKREAIAKKNGATIVHSLSFESALTDLLLSRSISHLPMESYRTFNSYYRLKSKQMSPGTKITMKIASAYKNYAVCDSELTELPVTSLENSDPIAPNIAHIVPYPEVIFTYKRIQPIASASHYLLEANDPFVFLLAAQKGMSPKEIDVQLQVEKHKKLPFDGPTEAERIGHSFEIHTYLSSGKAIFYQRLVGSDPYGITACLIGLGVKKFYSYWTNQALDELPLGVVTPAEFLSEFGDEWLVNSAFMKIEESKMIEP